MIVSSSFQPKFKFKITSDCKMEQHVFCIFINYRGRHRKGAAIYLRQFTTKTLVSWNKNVFFEHQRGSNNKKPVN